MALKIVKGSLYEMIKESLKETGGNCPCIPKHLWSKDTICICKDFKRQKDPGPCHCGMYEKIEPEETI